MSKIIVIGCPGSGKSTLAKKLHEINNYPLYNLDNIWHKEDKTTITREEFDWVLNNIFKTDNWIIDGNYQRTLEKRINACDTIILLDYPLEVCLEGLKKRVGVKREDMPWVAEELNQEFYEKVKEFPTTKLPEIYRLLEKYKNQKNIVILKDREQSVQYLKNIETIKLANKNQ